MHFDADIIKCVCILSPVLELYDLENWARVIVFSFSATVCLLFNLKEKSKEQIHNIKKRK